MRDHVSGLAAVMQDQVRVLAVCWQQRRQLHWITTYSCSS
jgi:hypothetical protein